MSAIDSTDLALLVARFGCARFGASRFGFAPMDVVGAIGDEPGEYVWSEEHYPETTWTLDPACVGPICGYPAAPAFAVTVVTTAQEALAPGTAKVRFAYTITVPGTEPYTYTLSWTGGGDAGPYSGEDPTITFTGTPGAPETISWSLDVVDDLGVHATASGTVDVVYNS